ncbi:MAG: T9SS type A sorting domain-containing protein, partial [Chitinophagaceae bacterium]
FSAIGSSAGKTMRVYGMKNGGAYEMLSDMKYIAVGTNRTENEFIFTSPVSGPSAFLVFTVQEEDAPIYIDNVKVYEGNVTITNPDDYIRFEYNATTANQSFYLNGTYVDVKNNRYSGNVNLSPFTSLILMKQNTSLVSGAESTSAAVRSLPVEDASDASALVLNVRPNPASEKIQILLNAAEGKKATMTINSVAGVTLKTIPVKVSRQAITVDISHWSKGVYFITLVYEDGKVVTKKFVKQ